MFIYSNVLTKKCNLSVVLAAQDLYLCVINR